MAKITDKDILQSFDIVGNNIIPLIKNTAPKNNKSTIDTLKSLFTGLGGELSTSAATNHLYNPHFLNDHIGWTFNATATVNKGIITITQAGDIRQTVASFTTNDHKVLVSVEYFSPSGGETFRLFISDSPTNSFFSNPASIGWSTLFIELDIESDMLGGTVILMLSGNVGTKIRNPKMLLNGDVDALHKITDAHVSNLIEATKFVRARLDGKHLVTLGDSITAQMQWQPTLVAASGMTFSNDETFPGTGGYKPMGMGSSQIIPAVFVGEYGRSAGDSIYMRADDVKFYNPDVIILMGGQNDGLTAVGSYPIYDIWEPAYTGGELPAGDPGLPSFVAAYKGILKKLTEQNPQAIIYTMTTMYNYTTQISDEELQQYITRRNLIKELSDMYSVSFIDNLTMNGMHWYNNDIFNPAVHPTLSGGIRLGELIARKL